MDRNEARIRPGSPDSRSEFLDRIVDLHVLAANGDSSAQVTAQQWLAEDPEARRVWNEVQRNCDMVTGDLSPR